MPGDTVDIVDVIDAVYAKLLEHGYGEPVIHTNGCVSCHINDDVKYSFTGILDDCNFYAKFYYSDTEYEIQQIFSETQAQNWVDEMLILKN